MRQITHSMLQMLSSKFQVGDRKPSALVFFIHPVTGERMRVDRLISVDIDRRAGAFAAEFVVQAENSVGWLTYSYDHRKFPGLPIERGDPTNNPWQHVIWPNTVTEIWLGYGDQIMKVLTGYVDSVHIVSDLRNINIRGRCTYKRAIHETLSEAVEYKDQYVESIVADLLGTRLGLPVDTSEQIKVWGTGERWRVPYIKVERAECYDSPINELVNTCHAVIYSKFDGTILLRNMPEYAQTDEEHHVLDESVNITQLEYQVSDYEIYSSYIIRYEPERIEGEAAPDAIQEAFENTWFRDTVLRGQNREDIVDVPWADTKAKRKAAAHSLFRRAKQKYYFQSVGTIGSPSIELYDLIRVREHVSTSSMKYIVLGQRTSFSSMGYFDILDVGLAT